MDDETLTVTFVPRYLECFSCSGELGSGDGQTHILVGESTGGEFLFTYPSPGCYLASCYLEDFDANVLRWSTAPPTPVGEGASCPPEVPWGLMKVIQLQQVMHLPWTVQIEYSWSGGPLSLEFDDGADPWLRSTEGGTETILHTFPNMEDTYRLTLSVAGTNIETICVHVLKEYAEEVECPVEPPDNYLVYLPLVLRAETE